MNKEIKKITGQGAVDHINNMCKLLGSDKVFFELEESPSVEVKKEKPIIIKSGDTWVAEYLGIDYLAVGGIETFSEIESDIRRREVFEEDLQANDGMWKPISEIEITDEIAKSRPIINIDGRFQQCSELLTYIGEKRVSTALGNYHLDDIIEIKLATVKDLQETK